MNLSLQYGQRPVKGFQKRFHAFMFYHHIPILILGL